MILQLRNATSETRARAVIRAPGKIDIVVVYMVDRLSCSLLDFAKLMDCFDHANDRYRGQNNLKLSHELCLFNG
jgi:hypothetical protein